MVKLNLKSLQNKTNTDTEEVILDVQDQDIIISQDESVNKNKKISLTSLMDQKNSISFKKPNIENIKLDNTDSHSLIIENQKPVNESIIESKKEFFPDFDIKTEFSIGDDKISESDIKPDITEDKIIPLEQPIIQPIDNNAYINNIKLELSLKRKNHGLSIFKNKVTVSLLIIILGGTIFSLSGLGFKKGKVNIIENLPKQEIISSGSNNIINTGGIDINIDDSGSLNDKGSYKEGLDFKIKPNNKKNIGKIRIMSGQIQK